MILKNLKIFDWDQYHTPTDLARKALLLSTVEKPPKICIDPSCGKGQLLDAAIAVFGNVHCIGIDIDMQAVAKLRRKRPEWQLATSDLLNFKESKYRNFFSNPIDLLLINPPFSLRNKKFTEIIYLDETLKCSLAMAHLLKSLDIFKPHQGAIAIIPESLLYSETDSVARERLSQKYLIQHLADVDDRTFEHANVRTCIVRLTLGQNGNKFKETKLIEQRLSVIPVKILRGGLPVYKSKKNVKGLPFVHTTDLKKLLTRFKLLDFQMVSMASQGCFKGWVVLIPRVGKPKIELVKAVKFPFLVQLSDCVIALKCDSRLIAVQVEERVKESWNEFQNLYKGTGARYITLSRLESWLSTKNINKEIVNRPEYVS